MTVEPSNMLLGRRGRTKEQLGVLKGDMEVRGKFNKLQVVQCGHSTESVELCLRVWRLREVWKVLDYHAKEFELYA